MMKVSLETPIQRKGADPITEVSLRKPTVGDLRGLKLIDVGQMDVKAVERLLPRITVPPLLPDEVAALDIADLFVLAGMAASFFMKAADREQVGVTE
jgi:hypothetical protein